MGGKLTPRTSVHGSQRDERFPDRSASDEERRMKVGYARVSTRSQDDSLDTQEAILREQGCEKVFRDAVSGARSSRPGFDAMLAMLRPDDVVYATRLDRLGRTALDTLTAIAALGERGVSVVLLRPELDTRTKEGRLMVGIMAHLAEFERDLLVERTREGLAAARARGHNGGRPRSITDAQRTQLVRMVTEGMGVKEAAQVLKISRSSAYAIVREARESAT